MPEFHKCVYCRSVVRTAQGLKSHITRLHSDRTKDTLQNPSQPVNNASSSDSVSSASGSSSVDEITQSSVPQTPRKESLVHLLSRLKMNTKVLRRIPKGARASAADALTKTINACLHNNSVEAWERLLLFTASCLEIPEKQEERNLSLTTLVKLNIDAFSQGKKIEERHISQKRTYSPKSDVQIAKLAESKIADGDITGAIRILSSDDTFAANSSDTLEELRRKHPTTVEPQEWPALSETQSTIESLQVTEKEVLAATKSFPAGSAGGPDMLRPQHLKDMLSSSAGNAGLLLLAALTKLCNVMLKGDIPTDICPVLYGASLCALKKKDGGIRPIAVGNTLRRLTSKLCSNHMKYKLSVQFQPVQLGFGTKGGAEAAVHAVRKYISSHHEAPKVILKIDFLNAFNMLRRDRFMNSVINQIPELYSYLSQCYREPSHLIYGEKLISSQRGIQQGDPMGSALFCLATHPLAVSMSSELNVWYLDDGTLGGETDTVISDLVSLTHKSKDIGLEINFSKCEAFLLNSSNHKNTEILDTFRRLSPEIRFPSPRDFILMGAPLSPEALRDSLALKTKALGRISDRLCLLSAHVGFFILKNALAIPKLSYVLRCAPTWKSEESLREFDDTLKLAVEKITNNVLTEEAWKQSALPIKSGGLGLRHAHKLALPAFLSSIYSVNTIVSDILPNVIAEENDHLLLEAISLWCSRTNCDPPDINERKFQSNWERSEVDMSRINLYQTAATYRDKARLLSVASGESGAFLQVLPSASLGTLLDDNAFRISIALRLGSKICQPHVCPCGESVDESGTHGLHCLKSAGRRYRHSAVNDILKRGLVSAGIPATLEPSHLTQDNRRPDGVTQIPWSEGKCLVWDYTCTDSFAPSLVKQAAIEPLYAANNAEQKKRAKYAYLGHSYIFTPIVTECLGSLSHDSLSVIRKIGRKITENTGEARATEYLLQRISVAVQRGNTASVMATIPKGSSLEEFLDLL